MVMLYLLLHKINVMPTGSVVGFPAPISKRLKNFEEHFMHISDDIFNTNRITNVEDMDKILFRHMREVRLSLS